MIGIDARAQKNARKTSRDADYEEDDTACDSDENSANSPETKPIRGSRYDPPASPKSVMVRVCQVRKSGAKTVKIAPKKTPKKPVTTRAQKVRKMVRKQVRKFLIFCQKRNASKAYQNRTSENDGEASNGAGQDGTQRYEKGYANCANSGTESTQNETDTNAQF